MQAHAFNAPNLSGTPFSKVTCHQYENNKGAIFNILRLGNDEEDLPKLSGKFWEVVVMEPGQYTPHVHKNSFAETYFWMGKGKVFINNEVHDFDLSTQGQDVHFRFPAGASHGFELKERTMLLSVQEGEPIIDPITGHADIHVIQDFVFPN